MKTVLVVDDDRETTDLYSIILMGRGYKVLVAHSVQKALEIAYTEKVDALLTDLYLGDGMGNELIYLMGKRVPGTLILVTGRDVMPSARFQGFDDYLVKPVECDLLVKTVSNCMSLKEEEKVS